MVYDQRYKLVAWEKRPCTKKETKNMRAAQHEQKALMRWIIVTGSNLRSAFALPCSPIHQNDCKEGLIQTSTQAYVDIVVYKKNQTGTE